MIMTMAAKSAAVFFAMACICSVLYGETCLLIDEEGANFRLMDNGVLVPYTASNTEGVGNTLQIMNRVLIADFNNPFDRALYNDHTLGCWTINPSDITQGSRYSFDAEDVKDYGFGSCVKVRYDVDCKGEAENGFWIKTNKIHISNCDYLSFWVRGSSRFGFTAHFRVGIRNDIGDKFEYEIETVSAEWQNYLIDLKDVKTMNQWSTINEIYFTFDSESTTKKKGAVYFDHFEYLTVSRL
jgi:hypothetical protein